MDKFKLKTQFIESITKFEFQLAHIWANVPKIECKYGVTEEYWLDFHKSIYISFTFKSIILMYNKKPLTFSFKKNIAYECCHLNN